MELYSPLLVTLLTFLFSTCKAGNANLFREYIGAESDSIKLSHVPINPEIEFHFILAFAIDYTSLNNSLPTNGKFKPFWASTFITSKEIASIKAKHPNVKFAISIGGDSIGKEKAHFAPKGRHSWVRNSISSLTRIIRQYHLDGIDIDYEYFHSDPEIFSECIGQLVTSLKKSGTISFAWIAPYDDDHGDVERNYKALWEKYGHVIDYVNFQFYAYEKMKSPSQFVKHFDNQRENYRGGQILASIISDGSGGRLSPENGFFKACKELKRKGVLMIP